MRVAHRTIIILFTLFALASCGGKKGELRIKGEIRGLNDAELTVFSSDGMIDGLDTIHVRQGKIDWSCPSGKEPGTLTIVYPTFSTLTVFGCGGDVVRIEGDAQHLKATRVSGNEDNEAYTLLREQTGESVTQQRRDSLELDFMARNPESPVTRFLHKERLIREKPATLAAGTALPDFTLVTRKGDTLSTASLHGKFSLLVFWANWREGSTGMNLRVRRLRREAKQPLECISYNMDVNSSMLDYLERTDTITWHSCGDKNAFLAELPSRLGIRDIPYYILADTSACIIASGTDWQKDIEPSLIAVTADSVTSGRDTAVTH